MTLPRKNNSPDRLVECDDCAELVVEDDWDIHKQTCAGRELLHKMREPELLDWLHRAYSHDQYWFKRHDDIEHALDRLMQQYEQQRRGYTMLELHSAAMPMTPWVPENAAKPTSSATFSVLTVRIPTILQEPEARALARIQLREQMEVFDV